MTDASFAKLTTGRARSEFQRDSPLRASPEVRLTAAHGVVQAPNADTPGTPLGGGDSALVRLVQRVQDRLPLSAAGPPAGNSGRP
jgi:hypothetical protein